MTPFQNPNSAAEQCYNQAHMKTRVKVENAIGQWKRRFGLLHQETRRHLKNIPADIMACAVLHNYAKDNNLPNDFGDDSEPTEVAGGETITTFLQNGFERRQTLAQRIYLESSN